MGLPPITPDYVLAELEEVDRVTNLRLPPTDPKFLLMLKDQGFAERAEAIVTERIALLKASDVGFTTSSARHHSLRGWERLLAKIEESLYQDGRKR